ncbi:MAG: patatin-like phospholipase family protein [Pseudomonadota bacterium]
MHVRLYAILLVCLGLAACGGAWNAPLNSFVADPGSVEEPEFGGAVQGQDDVFIALAFSGGGTRASAFSHGMLTALRDATASDANPHGLLRDVGMVTGVSGGSVTAAYFGLHGPEGVARYRDIYLVKDAEKYMANSLFNPATIIRGLSGGANSRATFARFLDETILEGATFAELWRRGHATTWINASDVANNTPFLFSQETFDALCSSLADLPLSEAVAASAAFPLVFSPITLKAHEEGCTYTEPDWLTAARFNPESTSALRAYGETLESYRDPDKIKFVKLLDGAITDNFGTTGLSVARAKAQTPFGPMTEAQAVRTNRMLFLVANAGVSQDYKWNQRIKGPGGVQLGMAIANSSMGSATRVGYDVLRLTLDDYAEDLIEWRCSLPASRVRALRGSLAGWDCADLKLFVGQVSFGALPDDRQDRLNEIPTRLRLPENEVDMVIAAGAEATRLNPEFNGFLRAAGLVAPPTDARRITARRITPSN